MAQVQHKQSGPLSIDMEITITNSPKNRSNTELLVPLCGVQVLPFAQPINTSNHRVAVRAHLLIQTRASLSLSHFRIRS